MIMKNQIMKKIPEGYKQTEIGVIPEDWKVNKLANVASLKARIGWQGLTTAEYKDIGEYYLITGTDFKNGFIDWENCHYVEKARYSQDKNIQIKEHDVLVTKDGTIGKVALINRITKPATLNSGVFVIRPFKNEFFPEYFYYLLLSKVFFNFLVQLRAGSTINHLYQKDFVNFSFQVPSNITEQTAIATVLSDTDALVEHLEKLIDKKKAIKQGTMQQLLTGKKRLLGFSGEWEVKKLGEVICLQGGYAFKSLFFTEIGVSIIRISDVRNDKVDTNNSVYYKPFNIPKDFIAVKGDILIAMSGATTGKIGVYQEGKLAYINQRVGKFVILNQKKTALQFVSQIVRFDKFKEKLQKEIAKGAQPNISGKQIESIELLIPPTKSEQTAIAIILSDMDAEIESLEQKRDKFIMLKQGMMQQLLTGRIRIYANN